MLNHTQRIFEQIAIEGGQLTHVHETRDFALRFHFSHARFEFQAHQEMQALREVST